MAEAHDWSPQEVDVMDADFITELCVQKQARADYELFASETDPKKAETKRKTMITRRKLDIIKRRERGSK